MNRPCIPARAMLQRQRSGKDGNYQPLRNTSPERLPRLGRHVSPGPELTKRPQTQSASRPLDRTQRVNQPTVNRTIAPGQARCPRHLVTLVCWRHCLAAFVTWRSECRHAIVRSCLMQVSLCFAPGCCSSTQRRRNIVCAESLAVTLSFEGMPCLDIAVSLHSQRRARGRRRSLCRCRKSLRSPRNS